MKTHASSRFRSFGLVAIGSALLLGSPWSRADIITVNSTLDADRFPSRIPVCETAPGNGQCTLRAAIQTANAFAGDDTINFRLSTSDPGYNGVFWTINLTKALDDISEGVTITGPGAGKLTVQRAFSASTNFRIFNVTTTGTVIFSGLTIANGIADTGNGGSIQNVNAGTVNVTDSTLSSNRAPNSGGGISNNSTGTINVTNSTLTSNFAFGNVSTGGGIYNNNGTVNFTNSVLSNSSAIITGGGIENNGTVNVTNSTISGNSATNAGGGIFNSATVNVTNSTISKNSVSFNGGGIFNNSAGTLTVTNSTLSDNFAIGNAGTGGGMFIQGGTVIVTNSTLSSNSANGSSAGGGGVFNNHGTFSITNSTFNSNSGTNGGGIVNSQGAVNIKSSIVALNTTGSPVPDVNGTFTSQGLNLIGKNDGAATSFPAGNPNANNDIVGTSASPVDPKLDPNGLKDNGGPTKTIALLFGSPAIDKGTSAGLTGTLATDQRGTGFARTFNDPNVPNAAGGDGTDIGAFELQPSSTPQPTPASKLANISTRAFVQIGDNVMIGGFIIVGADQKVIVRAIGPSLGNPPISLTNVLQNPTLSLFNSQGSRLLINDDWRSDQQADIIATGLQPSNDAESAIVTTLPPGNYTAIVSGVGDTSGLALVEVFALN